MVANDRWRLEAYKICKELRTCARKTKSSQLSLLYVNVAKDGSWRHPPGTGITSCYVTLMLLHLQKSICLPCLRLINDPTGLLKCCRGTAGHTRKARNYPPRYCCFERFHTICVVEKQRGYTSKKITLPSSSRV